MFVILCLAAGAAVLPFLRPPSINTSFDTLTVQDTPINHAVEASSYLTAESSSFWDLSVSDSSSPAARRLLAADQQHMRTHVGHSVHVIFHRADRGTMLTRPIISKVKAVEDEVYALPDFARLCLQSTNPETGDVQCRRPVSVTNFIYGSMTKSGFVPDGNSQRQLNPVRAAQVRIAGIGLC